MKKILLILSVFVAFNANAQTNNSSVLLNDTKLNQNEYYTPYTGPVQRISKTNKKSRAINGWMSYQDANTVQGLTTAAIVAVYPDSTLYVPNGTPNPFYYGIHALGTSFDPISQKFYDGLLGYMPPGNSEITANTPFTIDSIYTLGRYIQRVSQTDQLVIEITTTAGGALTLAYPADAFWFNDLGLTDSVHQFASPAYDWANNKMASPDVTLTATLDASTLADTNANGLNEFTFALPAPLTVPAGEKVTVMVRFVPGTPFTLGTDIANANYWAQYCIESNGTDSYESPYTGEYASGLIANTDARYNLAPNPIQGAEYLSSTYAFLNTAGFDEPLFSFYINCSTCHPISTNDIVKEFESVEIYPNPAADDLNIELTEATTNDVNVTIYSMTGKKLMTDAVAAGSTQLNLDISSLPSGVYVCELESNGATHAAKVTKK